MTKKSIAHTSTTLDYYQRGDSPKLLIHAGLHGDEFSVIPIVQEMVEKFKDELPEFLFVPNASPSAVALQTRRNANGLDLNRSFFNDSQESEVVANMDLVRPFNFDLLVSFHEDIEFEGFYMYDSAYAYYRDESIAFRQHLRANGIALFTGVDDVNDQLHGYTVVNGHVLWGIEWEKPLNGTFDDWAIKTGIVRRLLMPEVPTNVSLEKKKLIIESVFAKLIIPFFHRSH
jgi:hypothetical protein